jgi:hypothetical protein
LSQLYRRPRAGASTDPIGDAFIRISCNSCHVDGSKMLTPPPAAGNDQFDEAVA